MKFNSNVDLPVITSSERMDYKRCPKRWYWKWRRGLVPRMRTFGALDLGTWVHEALALWYGPGRKRNGTLSELFEEIAQSDIDETRAAKRSTQDALEKADELIALGVAMMDAYQNHYGKDSSVRVVRAEIPLEYTISHPETGVVMAAHKLKPDLVFIDHNGDVWLMEHKTAKAVQLGHLVIDDQARPYGAMAERSLRKQGIIRSGQSFRGILYNFMRKALPDQRPQNEKGQYLNQDLVTVSKRQPKPFFVRHPVTMTNQAKRKTLMRVQDETLDITIKTLELRTGELSPDRLQKTPHKSCEKTCPFFNMCVAEEAGTNIRDMERLMFRRENPYLYHAESTEDGSSFEIA